MDAPTVTLQQQAIYLSGDGPEAVYSKRLAERVARRLLAQKAAALRLDVLEDSVAVAFEPRSSPPSLTVQARCVVRQTGAA